jgi:hypothetical protein
MELFEFEHKMGHHEYLTSVKIQHLHEIKQNEIIIQQLDENLLMNHQQDLRH